MKFKYRPTPYSAFQAMMVEYELEDVAAFLAHADEHRVARVARLRKLAAKRSDDDDRYVDEAAEIDRVAEMAAETAIIFLYRVVEVHRDTLLKRAFPEFPRGSLERPEVLRALVLHTKSLDVRTLPGAADIEELRTLNNAVKHHARVTKELADRCPGWKDKVGEKLGDLRPEFARLKGAIPLYLAALAKAVGADDKNK